MASKGRPPIDPKKVKIPVTHRLSPRIVNWLQDQAKSGAVLIEDALCTKYDIPKDYKKQK